MAILQLQAPRRDGDRTILSATLALATGDKLTVSGVLTDASAHMIADKASAMAEKVLPFIQDHVQLHGDWSGVHSAIAAIAASVAGAVATHPAMPGRAPLDSAKTLFDGAMKGRPEAVKAMAECDGDPSLAPLREQIEALIMASMFLGNSRAIGALNNLRHQAAYDVKARQALQNCYDVGVCCCGKFHMQSAYDLGATIEHDKAPIVVGQVVQHVTDKILARSANAVAKAGAGMLT